MPPAATLVQQLLHTCTRGTRLPPAAALSQRVSTHTVAGEQALCVQLTGREILKAHAWFLLDLCASLPR